MKNGSFVVAGLLLAALVAGCGRSGYKEVTGEVVELEISSPEHEIQVGNFSKNDPSAISGSIFVDGEKRDFTLTINRMEQLLDTSETLQVQLSYEEHGYTDEDGDGYFTWTSHFRVNAVPVELIIEDGTSFDLDITLTGAPDDSETSSTREIHIAETDVRSEQRYTYYDDYYDD